MGKVHRIREHGHRHDADAVEVGTAFKKDEFKAKFTTVLAITMAGIVPPFGLNVGLCEQVVGQLHAAIRRRVAKLAAAVIQQSGNTIKHRRGKCFDRFYKILVHMLTVLFANIFATVSTKPRRK